MCVHLEGEMAWPCVSPWSPVAHFSYFKHSEPRKQSSHLYGLQVQHSRLNSQPEWISIASSNIYHIYANRTVDPI